MLSSDLVNSVWKHHSQLDMDMGSKECVLCSDVSGEVSGVPSIYLVVTSNRRKADRSLYLQLVGAPDTWQWLSLVVSNGRCPTKGAMD